MKYLLIAIAVMLIFPAPMDAAKKRNRVYVNDYTNNPVVAETVDDFNQIMPRRGPRLIYRNMYALCSGSITVCHGNFVEFAGQAYINERRIEINPAYRNSENVMCHEFMHILARVGDAYDTNPDSCIYGRLNDPGGADIALLRERYQRKKR
jgi:hypothetical protein